MGFSFSLAVGFKPLSTLVRALRYNLLLVPRKRIFTSIPPLVSGKSFFDFYYATSKETIW
jgi:hypothetical protein